MRLWLKDSERRPDPAPVATDDRKAVLVGIVGWVAAVAVVLAVSALQPDALQPSAVHTAAWLWTCGVGIALGLIGLGYTHARRSK